MNLSLVLQSGSIGVLLADGWRGRFHNGSGQLGSRKSRQGLSLYVGCTPLEQEC